MGDIRKDLRNYSSSRKNNYDITIDEDFCNKLNDLFAFIIYAEKLEFDKKTTGIINTEIDQMLNKIKNASELRTLIVEIHKRNGLPQLDECLPEALKEFNRVRAPEKYKSRLKTMWNVFKRLSVPDMIDFLECEANWAYTQTQDGYIVDSLSAQEYEDNFGYFQDEEDWNYFCNELNSNLLYKALCEANEVLKKYQTKSENNQENIF